MPPIQRATAWFKRALVFLSFSIFVFTLSAVQIDRIEIVRSPGKCADSQTVKIGKKRKTAAAASF
jgi:hypothetical protein